MANNSKEIALQRHYVLKNLADGAICHVAPVKKYSLTYPSFYLFIWDHRASSFLLFSELGTGEVRARERMQHIDVVRNVSIYSRFRVSLLC